MQDEVKTLEQMAKEYSNNEFLDDLVTKREGLKFIRQQAYEEGARAVLEFARSKARWGFTPDGDMVRIADLEAFVKGEQ